MDLKAKEFFLVELKDYAGLDQMTVRELRDSVIKGLESGLIYVSIISPEGVNRAEVEGHTCDQIEINEWIEVKDEDGNMDVVATANAVVRDMLITGMIIVLRDAYDELDEDEQGCVGWIDKIMNQED